MYLTNDKDNVLGRYLQKVEYLLVSELSIHHRTLSHNLSFTVGRLHIKLFLKLLNIHLLPRWHYFKLFNKDPATLCTYGRCLSTVNSKNRNSKEYGRSFISLFVKVAPPPKKNPDDPRSIISRPLMWTGRHLGTIIPFPEWRPTDSKQNVARLSIQRLVQLNKSDNDADKIKTWPDGHNDCRPSKNVVIWKP